MATIQDLLAYASKHATINRDLYGDPCYARVADVRLWRRDRSKRDRQRLNVFRTWPGRCRSSEPLVPGSYWGTRLQITASGEIDYTAGQYAGVELWLAVADYFERTNNSEA
jgi:hypothetical protein